MCGCCSGLDRAKLLYLDPAGEYVNDEWTQFLQRENIRVFLSAGESHWQHGRCERHGQIVKTCWIE